MTTTEAPAANGPDTGSVPVDAGQELLDQLNADQLPSAPADPGLYSLGCILSAAAMHIPAGTRSTVCLLDPPADEGPEIEVRATTAEAAAAIVAALPWKGTPITRPEVMATTVHHVTRGLLWGRRVAVVGVEAIPGGAL